MPETRWSSFHQRLEDTGDNRQAKSKVLSGGFTKKEVVDHGDSTFPFPKGIRIDGMPIESSMNPQYLTTWLGGVNLPG
jgi:hypothetical protein